MSKYDDWVRIFDILYKHHLNIDDCAPQCSGQIAWDYSSSNCHQIRSNNYNRRIEFNKFLKRYQGQIVINNIPDKLYSDLQGITDIVQLKKSMRRLGYSKYNKDIYYIFHRLTNIPLPDLRDIEEQLMIDFIEYEKAHIERGKGRNIRHDWALDYLLEKYSKYKKDEYKLR